MATNYCMLEEKLDPISFCNALVYALRIERLLQIYHFFEFQFKREEKQSFCLFLFRHFHNPLFALFVSLFKV